MRRVSSLFILFIVAHLNLAMPVNRVSYKGDICIMNNGIHMAHHSDNYKIHNHIIGGNYDSDEKGIHKIRMACNMDISSSDIYFPGGEHPFTDGVAQTLNYELQNIGVILLPQVRFTDGFAVLPDNPPEIIS